MPNDISEDNQYIPPENLKSPDNLNEIESLTKAHKIMINQTWTKTMIFNDTNKYQFRTRLTINNEVLETVEQTKLLGHFITNDLKWDKNTEKNS